FGIPFYNAASQVNRRTVSTASYVFASTIGANTYVPNGLNQYSTVDGATYGYDARGNLTSDGSGASARGFVYDIENRLSSVTVGGSTALTLGYDPQGRLKQTVAGATTTQFLYDGDRLTAEYAGTATSPLRRYVHGASVDEPLVWYEGATTANKRWYHTDQHGSVIATSDSFGN